MGNPGSASDGADGPTRVYNAVFIDSSLGTHLAMIVSDIEIVSDLKKKIALEHPQCFPNIGEIKIDALKVKRKGYFYHLSDSMLVKSAFEGVKKNWFLYLDASKTTQQSDPCFAAANPSDRNNLLLAGPSKKLSIVNDSSLLQFGNSQVKSNIIPANQFLPSNFTSGTNNLGMEAGRIPLSEDVNVPIKYTEHQEIYSKDVQFNNLAEEELETGSIGNKKPKANKKRKNEAAVHKHDLKENGSLVSAFSEGTAQPDIMGPENSHGNADEEIPTKVGCTSVATSIEHNKSQGETSASRPTMMRKRKSENKNGNESLLEKDSTLTLKHSNETSNRNTTGHSNSIEYKQKNKDVVTNGLSTESFADVHLLENDSGNRKKKRRINSKNPAAQVVSPVPSPKKAVRDQDFMQKVQRRQGNLSAEFNAASNPGQFVQGAAIEPCAVIPEGKLSNSAQEVVVGTVSCSSPGIAMKGQVASNPESRSDVSDPANASIVEHVRNLKGHQTVSAEDLPPPVVKESNVLNKDAMLSCQTDNVEEGELPQNKEVISPERGVALTLGETEKNVEGVNSSKPRNSSVKRVKSKAKKSVANKQAKSGTDHSKGFVSGMPLTNPDQTLKGDHSVDETRKEENILAQTERKSVSQMGIVNSSLVNAGLEATEATENEGEALKVNQFTKPRESMGHTGGSLRNISKKHRNVAAEDLPGSVVKLQDVSTRDPVFPDEKMEKGDAASKRTKNSRSKNKSSVTGSKLERPSEGTVMELDNADHQRISRAVDASSIPSSDAVKGNSQGRLHESKENGVEAAPQTTEVSKPQEIMTNSNKIQREKSKIHINVARKDLPESPMKEHDVSTSDLVFPNDEIRKIDTPSKTTKKTSPGNTSSKTGAELEQPNKDTEFVYDSSGRQKSSKFVDSSPIPSSDTIQGNSHGRPQEAKASENKVEEALQITEVDKPQLNGENMEVNRREKSKKQGAVATEVLPGSSLKEHAISTKDPAVANDRERKRDTSTTTKKTRAKKSSSTAGSNLEKSYKDTGTKFESPHHQRVSGAVDQSQSLSSHAVEDNSHRRPHGARINDSVILYGKMDDKKNVMDASTSESEQVNFNDYFVPSQCDREVAPTKIPLDEVTPAKRSDRELKAKKDSKRHDVHIAGATPNLETSHKLNEEKGSDKKSEEGNSARVLPKGSLSNSKFTPLSNRKSSNVSDADFEAPSYHDVRVDPAPKEPVISNIIRSGTIKPASSHLKQISAESNGASITSHSSFESSSKLIHKSKRSKVHQPGLGSYPVIPRNSNKKSLRKGVNNSEHKNSLLAKSGAIFNDYSSESSEDEDGVENSDASTRTPSDNSSSSGYSEGESGGSPGSLNNGRANGMGHEARSEKDIKKSNAPDTKNMTLDMIFRSSSRYKKAKLTAAQSQLEDTESEPIDFVPDSLPVS